MNRLDGIALGAAPPDDINVVVTATVGSEPLSLRLDRVSGLLTVTRLFHSAMRYPGNHGLVPQTRSENGEPLPALVAGGPAIAPGTVIASRPVGVLYVSGEGGAEEVTLLAVPAARLTPRYDRIINYTDLAPAQLRQVAHFFCHYRDVDEHGRARTSGWGDVDEARRAVSEAAERARRPVGLVD